MTFAMPSRSDYTKCKKKNPLTCRLHAGQYRKFQAFATEIRRKNEEEKLAGRHATVIADLNKNLNLKKDEDGTYSVSVFRSGVPEAPKERGIEKEDYIKADSLVPEGRQGRTTGVFASPTLGAVSRWVRGNDFGSNVKDIQVREIRIDPDKTYVYSVRDWEAATCYGGELDARHIEATNKYWNGGLTMTQWVEKAKNDPTLDPENWELLIPENAIKAVRLVSPQRAEEADYDTDSKVSEVLKRNRKSIAFDN